MAHAAIVLDVGRGEARLGATTVAIRTAGDGGLSVGGPGGPVLRPVTWGERLDAVALALTSPRARESLAEQLRAAATVSPGDADPLACEVLALHLAGAGEPAPPFAEAAISVVRATGWGPGQLAAVEAREVDRLASALLPEAGDAGWHVFLLGATDLADVRAELADDLLARGERRSAPGSHSELAHDRALAVAAPERAEPRTVQSLHASETAALDVPSGAGRTADRARSHGWDPEVEPPRSASDGTLPGGSEAPAPSPAPRLPAPPREWNTVLAASEASLAEPTSQPQPAVRARLAVAPDALQVSGAWAPVGELASSVPPPALGEQPVTRTPSRLPRELGLESHSRGMPAALGTNQTVELADALAALLDDEATLRGLAR